MFFLFGIGGSCWFDFLWDILCMFVVLCDICDLNDVIDRVLLDWEVVLRVFCLFLRLGFLVIFGSFCFFLEFVFLVGCLIGVFEFFELDVVILGVWVVNFFIGIILVICILLGWIRCLIEDWR